VAVSYKTDVLSTIDERMYLESKTAPIVNNGVKLEFSNGNNAVTIYTVNVVSENDYVRSGTMRYGTLVEIGNSTQTFVLSQDKSFAISIDRGNRDDAAMVNEIDDAVKRQVREVSVPTTDIYTLSIAAAYAVANSQSATAAITAANAFTKVLDARAALLNAKVNVDDIVLYVTPAVEAFLWLDPLFKAAADTRNRDTANGVMGQVMGMTVVVCPDSYYIANFGFMMLSKKVLVRPMKFNSIRTGDGFPFGIDGWVGFGRRYYDVFVPANKGVMIRLHKIA
jgi:hypothetical protein